MQLGPSHDPVTVLKGFHFVYQGLGAAYAGLTALPHVNHFAWHLPRKLIYLAVNRTQEVIMQ